MQSIILSVDKYKNKNCAECSPPWTVERCGWVRDDGEIRL